MNDKQNLLTIAIDCENVSYRRIRLILDFVAQLEYKNIQFMFFMNDKIDEFNSWKNRISRQLYEYDTVMLTHSTYSSKKNSQDVNLAVTVMNDLMCGTLGDLLLITGDKDFKPVINTVKSYRLTYWVDGDLISMDSLTSDKISKLYQTDPVLGELINVTYNNLKLKDEINMGELPDLLKSAGIQWRGKLKNVLLATGLFSVNNGQVSISE